jgi:hypothetical protein
LLVFAAATTVSSVIVLVVVFLAVAFWPEGEPFAPLSVSDVTINSRVEGIDGPATHVGSHYNGTVTICNNSDDTHVLTFAIQFERLGGPIRFVGADSVEFPMQPGCETLTGDSAPLPDEVIPGLWRESSSAIVQRGDQKQTVSFVSEPFEVLK